ncbi:MAG TPA: ACT domain-containing protein [Mucilaginibacter sp.]|jgi:hypothetical protein
MSGETNLNTLLTTMTPLLNKGDYVFCTIKNIQTIPQNKILGSFREAEGFTVIIEKSIADELKLPYSYISAWITLNVHSSLDAVGLTAAFSNALAKENIGCNVVAAYYHDHIFVDQKDAAKAMEVLRQLSADNS